MGKIILIVIICIVIFVLYTKIKSKNGKITGKWITLEKEQIKTLPQQQWILSKANKLSIPTFFDKTFKKKRKGTLTLKKDEAFEIIITPEDNSFIRLCVYDIDMNILYTIDNPRICIFTTEYADSVYTLNENVPYIYIINHPNVEIKMEINKYSNFNSIKLKNSNIDYETFMVDETEITVDYKNYVNEIKHKDNSRKFKNKYESERFFPIPHADYASKIEFTCKKNSLVVIIVTNKKNNGITKNHYLELDNGNIIECESSGRFFYHEFVTAKESTYKIIERLNEISSDSKILPFTVLIFE